MKLILTLKKKWFDMIASGIKNEEYRELKEYWVKRLMESVIETAKDAEGNIIGEFERLRCTDKFDEVEFKHGYKKNAPTMLFKLNGIRIGQGKTEWGAPENCETFILSLGERLK